MEHLDALSDEVIDKSDIPPLGKEFFATAHWRMPQPKVQVTTRENGMTNQFKNVDFDSIFAQLNKEHKKPLLWRVWLNWLLHRNMVKQSLTAFAGQASSREQVNWSEPYQDKKVARWGYLIATSHKGVKKVIGVKVEDDHLKVGYVSTVVLDKSKLSPELLEWLQAFEKVYGTVPEYNSSQNSKVFNIVEKCAFRRNELRAALEKVWKTLQKSE